MTQPTNLHPEDIRPGVYLIAPDGKLICVHFMDSIHSTQSWVVQTNDEDQSRYALYRCSGIPLSEPVLEAAGFVKSFDEYGGYISPERNGGRIRIRSGSTWDSGCGISDVPLLHLLQNLYRSIYSIDLTINAAQLAEAVKIKNETR